MRAAAFAAVLVVLASCAKRGRPGGGPEDTTPPFVARWSPPPGAAAVAPDQALCLTWSEGVDRRSVEAGLVVSPDTIPVSLRWEGKTLWLLPPAGWAPGLVHWVWVRSARDGHGIPMEEPFGTWFCVGDSCPPTRIQGTVKVNGGPARQAVVRFVSASTWTCFTDSLGSFVAPGLRPGRWVVEAFVDTDQDGTYDRGVEPHARAGVSLEDSLLMPPLHLAVEDTAPPLVRSVRAEHSRCVQVGFSEPLAAAPTEGFSLRDTTGATYPVAGVVLSRAEPAQVRLLLASPLRDEAMELLVRTVSDSAGLVVADTVLSFLGTSLPDTTPPKVYRLFMDPSACAFAVQFTEPMDSACTPCVRVHRLPDLGMLHGEATWPDVQTLVWRGPSRPCTVVAVVDGLRDLAGLPLPPLFASLPPDTTLPPWERTTLPP